METPGVLVIQIEISATTISWVLRHKNVGGTVCGRDLEQLTDFEVVNLELRPLQTCTTQLVPYQ
jgi:hypothetical protein